MENRYINPGLTFHLQILFLQIQLFLILCFMIPGRNVIMELFILIHFLILYFLIRYLLQNMEFTQI